MIRAVTSPMMTKQSGILILSISKRSRSLRGNTDSAVFTNDVKIFQRQDAVGYRAPMAVFLIGFQGSPGNQDLRLRREAAFLIHYVFEYEIDVHIIEHQVL